MSQAATDGDAAASDLTISGGRMDFFVDASGKTSIFCSFPLHPQRY